MANTVIQIKRSNATSAPSAGSLAAAEPAYSFSSDKLFLGNTNGTGVIEVGGKYWVNTTVAAYNQANAAYDAANSAGSSAAIAAVRDHANAAYLQANTALSTGQAAFGQANTARDHANASFGQANTATTIGQSAFGQANTALTTGQAAFGQANTSRDHSNAAFAQANTARDHANVSFGQANTATTIGSAAFDQANTAYTAANGKLSLTGGTITGNLAVTGSLTVAGNTYVIDAENLRVSDPLIYLAGNNYVSDIVDIGFIGNYVNATGSNVHTGLYREHEDKMYYLFQGYDAEPANNHIGAFSNNMTLAVLNADLRTSNLTLGGVNAITWITSSFNQANTARDHANVAFGQANTALTTGQAAFGQANTALTTGQAAFGQANTARDHANVAFGQANTARDHANVAFGQANTGTTIASAAYDYANSAARNAFVTIAANGTNVVADSNNDTLTITPVSGISIVGNGTTDTIEIGLTNTGVTATTYGSAADVGVFTVDAQGRITAASNASIAISATAITSGTLPVPYGGTGVTTFTQNGILYGNTAGALKITSAGTEGQVLQASSTGVPQFSMLDGGVF